MREQPQILVVDDNVVLRRVIRLKLESAGMRVITAGDGFEGLQTLLLNQVHLLVTDYQMPGVNGEELISRLRSDRRYARLPVILMTGQGYEIDTVRIKTQYGVNNVLLKPLSPNELLTTVCVALRASGCGFDERYTPRSDSNLVVG